MVLMLFRQRYLVKIKNGKLIDVTAAFPPTTTKENPAMPEEKTELTRPKRTRSRMKKVSYVLQVTCDKLPEMNEKEFLEEVRARIHNVKGQDSAPELIMLNSGRPRVSVLRRVEEYIVPGKGDGHGD